MPFCSLWKTQESDLWSAKAGANYAVRKITRQNLSVQADLRPRAICPLFSRGLHLFPLVKIRHFWGFLEVVEILVDAGAIVDLQNRDGSLLHVAAGRSSYQVVNPWPSRSRSKCFDLMSSICNTTPSATIHQNANKYAKVLFVSFSSWLFSSHLFLWVVFIWLVSENRWESQPFERLGCLTLGRPWSPRGCRCLAGKWGQDQLQRPAGCYRFTCGSTAGPMWPGESKSKQSWAVYTRYQ